MSVTLFGLIVIAVGIWCQFGAFGRVVVAMMSLVIFGSAAAVELPALGGASVTPGDFFILFFVLRLVSMRGGLGLLAGPMAPRRPLFVFLLLNLWILCAAIVTPRLFEGATMVFSLGRLDPEGLVPLRPTSGNLSQACYAIGGLVVACVTSAYTRRRGGPEALLLGLQIVTALDILLAVLDLATAATHTGFIMDAIHTGGFAFFTDDELGGVKRISGSFSEASAFSAFSLTLLGVNLTLYVKRIRSRFTGCASGALAVLIGLATSSTGYVGLAVLYLAFVAGAIVSALVFRRRRLVSIALVVTGIGIVAAIGVFLFLPAIAKVAETLISESLVNKSTSDSAIERGSWNLQAWRVFLDTYGVGGGIGSTRTSSYLMLLLSNLGGLGTILFGLLIARVCLGSLKPGLDVATRSLVVAARAGIAAMLVTSMLAGAVYYLGTLFYILVGVAAAGTADTASRRSRVRSVDPSDRDVESLAGSLDPELGRRNPALG